MKVFFTRRAERDYRSIQEHISTEWGEKVAEAFLQRTTDFLDFLEEFPEMGALEVVDKQIRGFQLTKHTRVFYRVRQDRIILLAFFDVRQNPVKRPG